MNQEKTLQENYYDTLFALLMHNVTLSEGEKALKMSEQLNSDPTAEVPEATTKRILEAIRQTIGKEQRHMGRRAAMRALNVVAVAIAIVALLFATAFASSADFRAKIMNLVTEIFDEGTAFHFGERESFGISNEDGMIEIGWLPDDLKLVEHNVSEVSERFYFAADDGRYILLMYEVGDYRKLTIDTENADMVQFLLGSKEAFYLEKNSVLTILIPDAEVGYVFLHAEGISTEELIDIAENIRTK